MSQLSEIPRPLVDKERRIIVLWSAKSACTMVYVWFSTVCGFLDEVREYNSWPHAHRDRIFRKSERYRQSLKCDTSAFHVVKIIRDPYTRAVSIFRHAIRNRLVEKDRISFREFLGTLARLDMDVANIHFRPQWHPFEGKREPDTIINISKTDLFGELNALERRLGWPVTDFAAMKWLHEMELERRAPRLPYRKRPYFAEPIVRSWPPKDTPFPEDASFLTPLAKRMIEEVYGIDFEAYGDYL